MAKGMQLVFPITTTLNAADLSNKLKTMRDIVKQKPLTIDIDIASETGKSLTEKLGGGEQFFNMVQQSVGNVGKLKTEYALFADSAGKAIKIATSETKEYRDETGNVVREVISLKTEEQALAEAIKQGGSAKIGAATAESNWRKQAQLTEAEINKEMKAVINNTKAAEKYLEKSKNQRGPQIESAKKAAQAVLDEGKALQKTSPLAKDFGDKVEAARRANENFRISLEATKTGANVFQNFTNRITNAIQQTIAYSFSIGLVYKAQQLLNDSIQYAIDLNTEMTKIQVLQTEGASTPEEINALAQSFNKLGQEMGASTLEIAKGSVEWFRQGRTVAETQNLMRASMMLSKLGAMESADATNYLTSITNAFKISVEDTASVVDKLVAVDNIAATSAGELATALRYTSETGALAGVSLEQLVSYIGTVSTVTRQNAEMIGQAFKTMFSRMTLIQGGGTDEEGWTISKVQKSLDAVGISMKEADGTFRNMGDVLEDTAAKWDTLGEREQIEIAVAIGGVRQKEAFLVLMDNMDKALQYQAAQTDASGLAMNRYGIYLESVEAKQGKLTAAMQALYADTVNSDMVKWFLDGAIAIIKFIDSMGGIPPLLVEIIALMVIFNRQSITDTILKSVNSIQNFIGSIKNLITNQKLLTITQEEWTIIQEIANARGVTTAIVLEQAGIAAGTYKVAATGAAVATTALNAAMGLLGIVAIAVTAIWQAYQKHLNDVKQAQEELTKAVEDYLGILDEFPEKQKTAVDLYNQIQIMVAKQGKEGLSTEEADKLTRLYNDLYKIVPNLKYSFDEFGNATLVAGQNIEDLEKATVDYYLATTLGNQDIATYFSDQAKMTTEANNAIDEAIEKRDTLNSIIEKGVDNINAEAQAYIDSVRSQGKLVQTGGHGPARWVSTASQMDKDLADAIEKAMKDGASGQVLQNMMTGWVQAASSSVSSNKGLISKQANDWKKMYMMVAHRTEPEYKNIRMAMELAAANNPELLAAMKEAEVDYQNQINEARLAAEKAFYEKYGATSATATTEQLNAEFKSQMQIIDQLTPSLDAMGKALMQTGDNSIALSDAVLQTNAELEKLATDTGLEVPIKSFDELANAAKTALDPTKVQGYRTELISWMMTNADLLSSNDILYNSLINKLIALAGTANTTMVEYKNETGAMASVTEAQWAQMTQAIAQQLYAVAQNQGIVFTDMNGNALTTVQQLQAALATQLLSFESAAIQSGQKTAKIMADLAKYMADLFKFITDLTPYEPAPINLPPPPGGGGGGGGGQKKDPRAEALEKHIKQHEDEIELMQEQLEIYDEQIEAIDRLIEKENRKKEVLQRQIDIYEEQKNDIQHEIDLLQQQIDLLDRQIEMYQRQIDQIDRQIEMYERQTEEIDRQIELYERQTDELNRQIELYERQKEAIDEQIALQEKLIEPLEAQKDVIDSQLDSFKEAIDLQKEALQLRKEEADFLDELTEKNKKLANLEAEIAIASLDTSEEGIARRLKLEEQAAAAKEDLAKTQEDRAYELQIRGLDDAYAAFEKSMNAQKALLDDQIAKINEIIDNYNKQKEAIDALIAPLEAEKVEIEDLIYPLEQQKIILGDIVYNLEQQKIPLEDAIYRLEQEKLRIEDLIYPLEQQLVALDNLIYPLQEQQEEIDLIIEKYELEKQAIEDLKQPIEDNIEKIGDEIEVLQDKLDLINDINDAVGTGGGTAWGSYGTAMSGTAATFREILAMMHEVLGQNHEDLGISEKALQRMAQGWANQGFSIDQATAALWRYVQAKAAAEAEGGTYGQEAPGHTPKKTGPPPESGGPPPGKYIPEHTGGIVSEHSGKEYQGELQDNEIFAKLLKGEYVATENQMKNFLRKTLPNIAIETGKLFSEEERKLAAKREEGNIERIDINGSPQPPSFEIERIDINGPPQRPIEMEKAISKPYENTYKDMNFEMNINVEGSLDKTVLPSLKKSIIKEINKSLERRGVRRTADNFAI